MICSILRELSAVCCCRSCRFGPSLKSPVTVGLASRSTAINRERGVCSRRTNENVVSYPCRWWYSRKGWFELPIIVLRCYQTEKSYRGGKGVSVSFRDTRGAFSFRRDTYYVLTCNILWNFQRMNLLHSSFEAIFELKVVFHLLTLWEGNCVSRYVCSFGPVTLQGVVCGMTAAG